MDWRERISVDPSVCHDPGVHQGKGALWCRWCSRNLATGIELSELLKSYPSLTAQDVHAAIGYAADLARQRTVSLPSGSV